MSSILSRVLARFPISSAEKIGANTYARFTHNMGMCRDIREILTSGMNLRTMSVDTVYTNPQNQHLAYLRFEFTEEVPDVTYVYSGWCNHYDAYNLLTRAIPRISRTQYRDVYVPSRTAYLLKLE